MKKILALALVLMLCLSMLTVGVMAEEAPAEEVEESIEADTISKMDLSLTEGSTLTGTINVVDNAENGTAVSNNAVVTIDFTSTWELTGDSSVTSLALSGHIEYGGYTITLADGTVYSADDPAPGDNGTGSGPEGGSGSEGGETGGDEDNDEDGNDQEGEEALGRLQKVSADAQKTS